MHTRSSSQSEKTKEYENGKPKANETVKESYAVALQSTPDAGNTSTSGTLKFRFLESDVHLDGFDTCLPIESMHKTSKLYMNTLFGYFLGAPMAFLILQNYVKNV